MSDHTIAPFAAETHRSVPGSLHVKTRSPITIGAPLQRPGIGVFQATFSFDDHLTGGLASGKLPVPLPRKPTRGSAVPAASAAPKQGAAPIGAAQAAMTTAVVQPHRNIPRTRPVPSLLPFIATSSLRFPLSSSCSIRRVRSPGLRRRTVTDLALASVLPLALPPAQFPKTRTESACTANLRSGISKAVRSL